MTDRCRAVEGVLERALDCVHCGLCLPACPTYALSGREGASPRGRIYLLRSWVEGGLEPSASVLRDLDQCLICRACEPVCPSGVRFGEMMEAARTHLVEPVRRSSAGARIRRWFLRRALLSPARLGVLVRVLRFYQRSGLQALLRRYGVLRYLSSDLAARDALLPEIPPARRRRPPPVRVPARGPRLGRVAVLPGCVQPLLLGEVPRATTALFSALGFEVVRPERPLCCGALAAHFGAADVARDAAIECVRAYEAVEPFDVLVLDSAGCGAHMKDLPRLLEREGAAAAEVARARALAAKVRDWSEVLAEMGNAAFRPLEIRAGYADACHLVHGQRLASPPRAALGRIPGLEVVDLDPPDRCCGAAGLYAALQPRESLALLDARLAALERARVSVLAVANPGCLLQWRAGVRSRGLDVRVVHPVELLAEALHP